MSVAFTVIAMTFALWVLVRPVFTLLADAFEAWGYARMYGLSRSLGWRLFGYAQAWIVAGTIPAALTWSL